MLALLRKSAVPALLRGPILLDSTGLPRFWVSVWTTFLPGDLSESTVRKQLSHLASLYSYADNIQGPGSLDDALAAQDFAVISKILEGFFVSMKNLPTATNAGYLRWQTSVGFVRDVLTRMRTGAATDGERREFEMRMARFEMLYAQLSVRRNRRADPVRSLPASVVEELYTVLDPDSSHNPLQNARSRWRAYVQFVALLHLGLRRGELLILPVDAVKSKPDATGTREIFFLHVVQNDYEEDPRYSKPSIKTVASIRELRLDELSARVISEYVENYRGRPNHSFLLNSQVNSPLSTEGMTKLFLKITASLSKSALTDLKNCTGQTSITPHSLRHTCAVVRLSHLRSLGDDMEAALQKMRAFFGWSRSSNMPQRYARAYFEDSWASLCTDIFDDRVAVLRALPKGVL